MVEAMNERRKFMRFNTNNMVEYRLCREREIDGTAIIKDLSRGGMRFSISRKLEKGALLNIKLILSGETEPIYLMGEVAWVSEPQDKKDFEYFTGVKFFKIDNFDKARILNQAYMDWLASSSM